MKKINWLIIITILCAMVIIPCTCYADLIEIDPFTGEAKSGDMTSVQNITVDYDCIYNRTNDVYRYTIASLNGIEIQSNVARGMVTQSPVSLSFPEGVTPTLYKEGIVIEGVDFSNITALGSYSVALQSGSSTVSNVIYFTIVGDYCGYLYSMELPSGFQYVSVYKDGQAISPGSLLDLSEEGEYIINTVCTATQKSYSVKTIIDHTAPTLALEAVNEKGIARGPVDISDQEEGTYISVYLNDKLQSNPGTELTGTGHYIIVLTDQANNTTNYQFQIQMYFDMNSWILIGILVLLIGALVGYIFYTRKHLRVR